MQPPVRANTSSSEEVMDQWYVGFEGPIGAGKTTLASLLAAHVSVTPLLEEHADNAFLADFYRERSRWALPMQLSFLISRIEQLQDARKRYGPHIVADHTIAKDALYAGLLLEEREYQLYSSIGTLLNRDVELPDLIVYLDTKNDTLLERIRLRRRAYEADIDHAYLDAVRAAYGTLLRQVPTSRVLRVDTGAFDLKCRDSVDALLKSILTAVGPVLASTWQLS